MCNVILLGGRKWWGTAMSMDKMRQYAEDTPNEMVVLD
jgi:hypothetical protein